MTPLDYRWAHAVNSYAQLDEVKMGIHAAKQTDFSMKAYANAIEADIIWSDSQQCPVMGHPPQTDSELTLQAFLQEMITLTQEFVGAQRKAVGKDASSSTPFIVKLDFKSMQAFQVSYEYVRAFIAFFPFHKGVFINADILLGPATLPYVAFDAGEFLQMASTLGGIDGDQQHKLVLSVGWTTSNTTDEEIQRCYSPAMIDEMLRVLQPYSHVEVTFPIRATSVRNSWAALQKLLQSQPNYGFTLWWAKSQMPDEELEWLYSTLECSPIPGLAGRTFYDILGFESFLERRK